MTTVAKITKLRSLGYTAPMNNAFLAWLLARGATTPMLQKAELEYLVGKGFTSGALNDRWIAYLRSLTYTGSREDMEVKFWQGVNSN